MTLYRNLFKTTRPYLYASAAGFGLCSMTVTAHAQAPYLVPAPPVAGVAEPNRLPQGAAEPRPLQVQTAPVALTAGEVSSAGKTDVQRQLEMLYEKNGREMPQMPRIDIAQPSNAQPGVLQPSAGAQRANGHNQTYHTMSSEQPQSAQQTSGESPSIFSRMTQALRKPRAGKNPPVDPGITYPTQSQAARSAPPQAPGVPMAEIPALPPIPGAHAPQPGFFQPPAGAHPIAAPAVPQTAALPEQPKNIDQLKQMLQPVSQNPAQQTIAVPTANIAQIPAIPPIPPGAAQAPNPPANSYSTGLPVIDFNAPLPQNSLTVAPAEPSEPKVEAAPVTAQAAERSPAADPFNNLFPDDEPETKAPAAAVVAAPQPQPKPHSEIQPEPQPQAQPQVVESKPYTGLSLEEDLFVKDASSMSPDGQITVKAATPPVKEPVPAPAEVTEIKTAQQTPLLSPETAPTKQMPVLELGRADQPLKLTPPIASLTPPTVPPAAKAPVTDPNVQMTKMERIAARKHQAGLKGFCPVVLRDHRDLVDSKSEFSVIYNGQRYEFSSAAAMETFLDEPLAYVPAAGGSDVIHLALTGQRQSGSLDHAVWYKGRLYLFSGVETMETFVAAPSGHATEE